MVAATPLPHKNPFDVIMQAFEAEGCGKMVDTNEESTASTVATVAATAATAVCDSSQNKESHIDELIDTHNRKPAPSSASSAVSPMTEDGSGNSTPASASASTLVTEDSKIDVRQEMLEENARLFLCCDKGVKKGAHAHFVKTFHGVAKETKWQNYSI